MVTINNNKIADIGYFINLDSRVDRKEILLKQLDTINLNGLERYSAYDKSTCGVVNCATSHFKLYEKLIDSNYDTMLVLEDDCLFLEDFILHNKQILADIYSYDWDIFWLGTRQRRSPKHYNGKVFQVSSPAHTQSYIIKKDTCKDIIKNYYVTDVGGITSYNDGGIGHPIDEFLCLYHYGYEMVNVPNDFKFYESEQPLDDFKTHITELCYNKALTTQYTSQSNVTSSQSWAKMTQEEYITNGYEIY